MWITEFPMFEFNADEVGVVPKLSLTHSFDPRLERRGGVNGFNGFNGFIQTIQIEI